MEEERGRGGGREREGGKREGEGGVKGKARVRGREGRREGVTHVVYSNSVHEC